MPGLKLVVSDLHLGDGHAILDEFGERQLTALRGLLRAAQAGELSGNAGNVGNVSDVELIINGDCFDFLAIPPYSADGIATPDIALAKLAKIVSTHPAFFETLRDFLHEPGARITFMAGNHDAELAFAEVRRAVHRAICADKPLQGLTFCETRFYRPLPDVYIEHGHQYDFWNHTVGVWNEDGNPVSAQPAKVALPVGTQYFQRAAYPMSARYPYFDHFEPSIDTARQIALLCLLDPELVKEVARSSMRMLSYQRTPLEGLGAGEERIPARLFEIAMLDFAAFQQDMIEHKPEWQAVEAGLRAHPEWQKDQPTESIKEYFELRDALALPPLEAIKTILGPRAYAMGESVAIGMQNVLRNDPTLHYTIAGHTHMLRHDALNDGSQVYLNTATWTNREFRPMPDDVTPELVKWLREPLGRVSPLRDMTSMVFALLRAEDGHPSTASLCEWVGGEQGHYHVLS